MTLITQISIINYKMLSNGSNRAENTETLDHDNSGGKFCSKADNQKLVSVLYSKRP